MSSSGRQAEQSGATQSSYIDGGQGAKPLLLEDYFNFSKKKVTVLTPFGSHFARFQSYSLFERIKLLRRRSQ